ncbi:hypothetical protein [Leptobacterium sp. I13]|uniref:tetratricopeptide repeat protein n=1 Tax=Leptobacterium meishanense TaxID=3128904 RepID=UPI0030EBE204
MYKRLYILIFIGGSLLFPASLYAQEETADITNEGNEDAFQEFFFEALKQQGIENYEKAIEALLECKKLAPENAVIDYELGKNYLQLNQHYKAEDHILKAVNAVPENEWYLDMLYKVYEAQNNIPKAIVVLEKLADKNISYQESLITLYSRNNNYEKAIALIDVLDKEFGKTTVRKNQRIRFQQMIEKKEETTAEKINIKKTEENPIEAIQAQLEELIENNNYNELLKVTIEALESYPSQAIFYYANGLANNRTKNYKQAISSLKTALDFLIDDEDLQQKIYEELIKAYNEQGDTKKANEYLKRQKGEL